MLTRTVTDVDVKMLVATLEMSSVVDVPTVDGPKAVAVVRRGDWRGSTTLGHYSLMLLLSRVWRFMRRERGWLVEVREPDENRGDVVGTALSRAAAIDLAVKVAERLSAHGST